jgi:hypothetical protein
MFMHRLVVADVADPTSQNAAMHSGAAVSDARLQLRDLLWERIRIVVAGVADPG